MLITTVQWEMNKKVSFSDSLLWSLSLMAGHSIPLMTRTDAKVNKTALALERSPYNKQHYREQQRKSRGGLEDILSGEIYICMEKQIQNEESIPKSQGLWCSHVCLSFSWRIRVCFLINESQTFSSQTSITRWKQMDDIPYLMVLFSVKWSQRGKGLFWSYRICRRAENERKSRLGGKSWGRGQATLPGPGAGSGLGIKASPHCGQHLACVACACPELCLILFGVLGHYAGAGSGGGVTVWS